MEQFDPNIPGLLQGNVSGVIVTDPQPFVGGSGNHVIDPGKNFTLSIAWEVFGQLAPLWLAALGGDWSVDVYAESLGGGPEIRVGGATVPASSGTSVPDPLRVNLTTFLADVTVPAGTLPEHIPGADQSGIYKLVVAVFLNSDLNSDLSGTPGFDLVGYAEGPIIQAEPPE